MSKCSLAKIIKTFMHNPLYHLQNFIHISEHLRLIIMELYIEREDQFHS